MGVDFFLKDIALESDHGESSPAETVRVQLWDIAGQDRAKKINRVSDHGGCISVAGQDWAKKVNRVSDHGRCTSVEGQDRRETN